jgi:hypothetical protein
MHFSQKVPLCMLERRMNLSAVARARAAIEYKPSWYAIFAKAHGLVAAKHPEFRRSYLTLPWARLFEHAHNIAMIPIERKLHDEDVVLYVPVVDPELKTLADLDAGIRYYKDEPLDKISFFRTQIWTSCLPQPIRRLMWWLGLNLMGRLRAYFYGTFGVTGVGAYGAVALNLLSPLTTTITYGVFEPDGNVSVRLCFDHRVMDGAIVARALGEIEAALNGEILAELRGMSVLRQAPLAA